MIYLQKYFDLLKMIFLIVNQTGTVPIVSALYPVRNWRQTAQMYSLELAGTKHMDLIANPSFYATMIKHATIANNKK
jgi:hypothetical protein